MNDALRNWGYYPSNEGNNPSWNMGKNPTYDALDQFFWDIQISKDLHYKFIIGDTN